MGGFDQAPDEGELFAELSAGAVELLEQVLAEHPHRSLAVEGERVSDGLRVPRECGALGYTGPRVPIIGDTNFIGRPAGRPERK